MYCKRFMHFWNHLIRLTLIPTHPTLNLGLHRDTHSHPFFLVNVCQPICVSSYFSVSLVILTLSYSKSVFMKQRTLIVLFTDAVLNFFLGFHFWLLAFNYNVSRLCYPPQRVFSGRSSLSRSMKLIVSVSADPSHLSFVLPLSPADWVLVERRVPVCGLVVGEAWDGVGVNYLPWGPSKKIFL